MPKRTWVRGLLLVVALGAGVLAGLPYVIKHYATRWLHEHGGDRVQFEDVDFNPVTAVLLLKGLTITVDDETTLAFASAGVDLAWRPLLRKQVRVEAVTLSGMQITVDQRQGDRLLIGGIRLPDSGAEDDADDRQPPEATAWSAGLDTLNLNDVRLHYLDEHLDLHLVLDHLKLGDLSQWSAEQPTPLDVSGSLNGASFSAHGEIAPLATLPRYELELSLEALPLVMFGDLLQDRLPQLEGKLSYTGTLGYAQLTDDGYRLHQQGDTRLQSFAATARQPAVALSTADAILNSRLTVSAGDGEPSVQAAAELQVNELALSAPDSRLTLLRSGSLALSGLTVSGVDQLAIDTVRAEQLDLARALDEPGQTVFMDVDRFELSALALKERRLSIERVVYDGGHSRWQRGADGTWNTAVLGDIVSALAADSAPDQPDQPAPAATGDDTPAPLAVAVGRVEITGDSSLELRDESVQPAFASRLDIDTAVIETLDTRRPDQTSPVQFEARIGKYTRLSLQGQVQPFAQPVKMDLTATVQALDLPPLSPYTQDALGLALDSGTLDADTRLKTDATKMDGLVKLDLHQLAVKTVEHENSLQSRIPLPLNVALDTLRDRHNTISLKIPVKGDPENPDFNINDALTTALAGGVQKGALTYLTFALQPYGALITAAKYAGEEISKLRLQPVAFEPGQTTIDDTHRDYLSKVAGLLADRPKLTIKLCGVATPQDTAFLQQQALAAQQSDGKADAAKAEDTNAEATLAPPEIDAEALQQLAQARADNVKTYLIETFRTPASHLVSCQPRIDTDSAEPAAPRTDLLI